MPGIDDQCAYCGYTYGIHFTETQGVACPDQPGKRAVPPGSRGWFHPVQWVKCLDTSDLGSGTPALTKNKVYKVTQESSSGYYVVNDNGNEKSFAKRRFQVVSDPNAGMKAASPVQAKAPPKEIDISDWRVWRSQAPGQCACGIDRQRCDYHKDVRS